MQATIILYILGYSRFELFYERIIIARLWGSGDNNGDVLCQFDVNFDFLESWTLQTRISYKL
jgi:hypothetical protein